MLSERDDLPVYTTATRPTEPDAGGPEAAAAPSDIDHTVDSAGPREPTLRHPRRQTERAIKAAYREPLAIMPWVGVLATIIWLPLAILATLWLFIAYRRSHRGVMAATIALVVVIVAHWFNGHLAQPFF